MPTLFFDIETVIDESINQHTLDTMKEKIWENFDFMPEFHKILTICVWKLNPVWEIEIKALDGTEKEMIEKFFAMTSFVHDFQTIIPILCWYNIKSFDIPFIVKRALLHGVPIPSTVKLHGKKPWDMTNILDLYDEYKHMWYKACSLDTLCKFLSIPTPKDGIDGSQVQEYHNEWKDDEIIEYCKRDVEATILIHKRFSELNFI